MPEGALIATRVVEAAIAAELVDLEQVDALRNGDGDDARVGGELVTQGLIEPGALSSLLEDEMGFPRVDVGSYEPDVDAVALVDAAMARAYKVLPLFEIEGTLTVAIGEPQDIFLLDDLGARLNLSMDAVLGDLDAVARAIDEVFPAEEALAEPPAVAVEWEDETGAAPHEAEPAAYVTAGDSPIDLDVLAVADEGRVAVLISDILELAVQRGADKVHLLPYKSEFFLVFRQQGRLDRIASGPLSLQRPLVDGFKNYVRLETTGADRPALGRAHAELGGRSVVLTVSCVPTLAGQRLVVQIEPSASEVRGLSDLGLSDAEQGALSAMVERGRGLVLVTAPVAGGGSTTYYALLQHAAQAGKTVYSVERSIEHEIPAVAQVLVNPGQPTGAAGYLSAGLRQDTDVVALDSVQSAEELQLAIEAAGLGKLVVVTIPGAGIVAGVRRLLDLGAEPESLASALTLGVGQRLARTNCTNCATDENSPLLAQLAGATDKMAGRRGAGCAQCAQTGFGGVTGIFEVLPFTEPVRAVIADSGGGDAISAAAGEAGMRPMSDSGLAKVAEGLVSAEELARVLRFAR